jgi:hypothetical protein
MTLTVRVRAVYAVRGRSWQRVLTPVHDGAELASAGDPPDTAGGFWLQPAIDSRAWARDCLTSLAARDTFAAIWQGRPEQHAVPGIGGNRGRENSWA